MSQADVARAVGVKEPTVFGWLNDGHGITWANARKLAKALNKSPGWIMFGTDSEAERVAQTRQELSFLRIFRTLSDDDQVAILRYMSAMQPALAA